MPCTPHHRLDRTVAAAVISSAPHHRPCHPAKSAVNICASQHICGNSGKANYATAMKGTEHCLDCSMGATMPYSGSTWAQCWSNVNSGVHVTLQLTQLPPSCDEGCDCRWTTRLHCDGVVQPDSSHNNRLPLGAKNSAGVHHHQAAATMRLDVLGFSGWFFTV